MVLSAAPSVYTFAAPAKVNLHLSITGRRADGYHEIVSVAARLSFGDSLRVSGLDEGGDRLECDDPALGTGPDNLVLRALSEFRKRAPLPPLHVALRKRIPAGAGLGGGSSDAAAALRAAQRFSERPLEPDELHAAAAEVGSDCPMFLYDRPVVLRGRGERVETLPEGVAGTLRGRRVWLVSPGVPIATADAYAMVANERRYDSAAVADAALSKWFKAPEAGLEEFCYNRFTPTIYGKYRYYGALAGVLERAGLPRCMLSGSGSALFVLPCGPESLFADFERTVTECLGSSAFRIESTFL